MKTTYKILFSVQMLHDYYTQSDTFEDIEIIPTGKTKLLLSGNKILYRFKENKLTALIESDSGKPFVKISNDMKLRFVLKLKNPAFKNISTLKLFDARNYIYYFSNRAANESNGRFYLSKPIPAHDPADDYETGSLIQALSDTYEAISGNTNIPPPGSSWRKLLPQRFPVYDKNNHKDIFIDNIIFDPDTSKNYSASKFIPGSQAVPVTDTAYWKEVTGLQYVTSDDLIDKEYTSVRVYEINNHNVIFTGDVFFNESDSKLYKALKFIEKGNAVPVTDINYWQEININKFVLSDDSISGENVFGVLDLFFDNTVPGNYKMLDVNGNIKELNYVIRFKNRITTWKYISQKNTVTSLTDVHSNFNFIKAGNEFISDMPIPLMSKPMQNFKLNSVNGSQNITVENLKCATPDIKPVESSRSFISEIFLNY